MKIGDEKQTRIDVSFKSNNSQIVQYSIWLTLFFNCWVHGSYSKFTLRKAINNNAQVKLLNCTLPMNSPQIESIFHVSKHSFVDIRLTHSLSFLKCILDLLPCVKIPILTRSHACLFSTVQFVSLSLKK